MRRFRLKSLRAGIGPIGAEVEITQAERDFLHPLFVVLRDKRALLYAPHGREDTRYVTESIENIRAELTTTLKALAPDAEVVASLEVLRQACREYLDAVAASARDRTLELDFGPALAELRDSFRDIAEEIDDRYDLPSARALAEEMRAADEDLPPPLPGADPVEVDSSVFESPTQGDVSDDPNAGRTPDPLIEALHDRDDMVRFTAMAALRDHLTPNLLPIIEPLLKDRDSDIRRYALEYYAEIRPPDTRDRLVDALHDHDDMVRFTAMAALRDHLTPKLLPIIEPLLKDRDSDIRRYALEYYADLHKQ